MPAHYTPTLFTRHNRPLHTLWLDSQAWFCAREFGRLIGRYLDDPIVRKLDKDQHRCVPLLRYGQITNTLMISESGAYTLLAHHHIPENRHLRRWLTHQVVAVMRDAHQHDVTQPVNSVIHGTNGPTELLHWRDTTWIRLDGLAEFASPGDQTKTPRRWQSLAGRFFRL